MAEARVYGLDVRRREQGRDDGIGDLVLDDSWRLARPVGMDDDFNVRDVGKRIEGDLTQAPDAGEHEHERSRENEEAIARAPVDQAGEHVTSLPSR